MIAVLAEAQHLMAHFVHYFGQNQYYEMEHLTAQPVSPGYTLQQFSAHLVGLATSVPRNGYSLAAVVDHFQT